MTAHGDVGTPSVVAAIVSYNRRILLLEALAGVFAQTRPADAVVVIDNNSDDDSAAAVRATYPSVHVVELARNTGGAGGFAVALDTAVALGASAVWLLDDDVVPEPGALAALLRARDAYPSGRPAAVASHVVWVDGRTHPMNIPRRVLLVSRHRRRMAEAAGCSPMRTASFCSLLLDAEAVRDEAPPIATYFIWNDDVEYTARLLRHRIGLLCPASTVVHKTAVLYNSVSSPGPRSSFDVRNTIWMLTRSRGLAGWERLYYTAASADRWVRAFWGSTHKREFARFALRGFVAGLRTSPRDTAEELADVWDFEHHRAVTNGPTRGGAGA